MLIDEEAAFISVAEVVEEYDIVGKSFPRTDARDKVRGSALYLEDIKVSGMLYGKVLRSKYAHARMLSINSHTAPGFRRYILPMPCYSADSAP